MRQRRPIAVPKEGDRMLFVRFSSLGDVLLALGKAKALKTRFPGLHLTWLTQAENAELLQMQPFIDDVLPWDIKKGRFTVFPLIGRIRRARFQFLYSVHANDRSALISAFSGIPTRVGFHKNLAFAYDCSPAFANQAWGVSESAEEGETLFIPRGKTEELRERLRGKTDRYLFCAIGASKRFKRWPSECWSAFLEKTSGLGLTPVLIGNGREEEQLAAEIASSPCFEGIDLVGKLSLVDVCALASLSELAIGGDTGPIHLARMTGIPCIGLFAVEDPARYGHRGKNLFPLLSERPYQVYPEKEPTGSPLSSISPERAVRLLKTLVGS